MKLQYLGFVLISGLIVFHSCKKDTTDYASQATCTGTTPTYTNDVAAILNTRCALGGCHNASSAEAGINLSTYASASSQFLNNDDNLTAIHHGSGVKAMPDGEPQMAADIINKLDCWVKNGCPQ
jgi:hypothetical protein